MTTIQRVLMEVRELKEIVSNIPSQKEWLTVKEACAFLGINKDSLRRLRYQGKLKNVRCRKSGRGHKYHIKELESLLITIKP